MGQCAESTAAGARRRSGYGECGDAEGDARGTYRRLTATSHTVRTSPERVHALSRACTKLSVDFMKSSSAKPTWARRGRPRIITPGFLPVASSLCWKNYGHVRKRIASCLVPNDKGGTLSLRDTRAPRRDGVRPCSVSPPRQHTEDARAQETHSTSHGAGPRLALRRGRSHRRAENPPTRHPHSWRPPQPTRCNKPPSPREWRRPVSP